MLHFYWHADAEGTYILYMLACGIVALTGWLTHDLAKEDQRHYPKTYSKSYPLRHTVAVTAITTVVLLVIVNLMTAFFSLIGSSNMYRTGSYRQAAASFGLESGKSYPLVIGGLSGGSSGTNYAHAGVFSATAVTSLQPATALTLSFSHGGDSWALTVPTNLVTFHQRA